MHANNTTRMAKSWGHRGGPVPAPQDDNPAHCADDGGRESDPENIPGITVTVLLTVIIEVLRVYVRALQSIEQRNAGEPVPTPQVVAPSAAVTSGTIKEAFGLPPQRWLPAFLDPRDRKAAVAALCLELDGVADLDLLKHRAIPDLIDQGHVFLEAKARSRTLFQRDAPAALIDLLDLADNRCVLRNGTNSQHGHQQRPTSRLLENLQNGLLFVSSVSSEDSNRLIAPEGISIAISARLHSYGLHRHQWRSRRNYGGAAESDAWLIVGSFIAHAC